MDASVRSRVEQTKFDVFSEAFRLREETVSAVASSLLPVGDGVGRVGLMFAKDKGAGRR